MGIACWTICLDCDEEAPEMGDCGYLGFPSLEERAPDTDVATFGSIYAGLAAVHLVTEEVEAFRRFLESHKGHKVVTDTEGGSPFGDDDEMDEEDYVEGEEEDEDELEEEDLEEDELEEDALEEDELDEDEVDEDELEEEDSLSEVAYPLTRYRATCMRCDKSFVTSETYPFVPFDRATLTGEDVQTFRRKVVAVMDAASYRAEPLSGSDLKNLDTFFKRHGEHGLMAELLVEGGASP